MKLPVIDFSNLNQETPNWEIVKTQVMEALVEYGCFEAIFDRIPVDLRESVFGLLRELFDLPSENKLRNKPEKAYQGYIKVEGEFVPTYESLAINDALSPGTVETFTNQMWSQGNPNFSKSMESYIERLSEMDKMVRRMVVESLGLEKYMDEHIDESTGYLVRVQKYFVPQAHETQPALPSHTDENSITILSQNGVNGLQVLTKDGQWITTEPSPGSFIVVVGNSYYAWTNGRLHVPYHRVMMTTGDKPRYSFALFSAPKPGYLVKAPEEMVDEEHPLLFKPFDFAEYLDVAYSGAPGTVDDLKQFCGV